MKSLSLALTIFSSVCLLSCNGNKGAAAADENFPFTFKGLLQKTEMTSYMYGTHSITNKGKTYALQSTSIDLNLYSNKRVTVKGSKVEGYPVDGGPELIDVKAVDEK